jgi:hypothetical protein
MRGLSGLADIDAWGLALWLSRAEAGKYFLPDNLAQAGQYVFNQALQSRGFPAVSGRSCVGATYRGIGIFVAGGRLGSALIRRWECIL